MGDKYKSPTMDWSSPGDIHKRFQLFRQKCDLIFAGPLADKEEEYKVRMLLLWIDDKGLEIYNTSAWQNAGDNLLLDPVWERLEGYVRPRSNQILARFQLRCLKQGDMQLEEFITKARTLVDDGGYDDAVKEETLRDTLVFGIKSDKARRDAIAVGNALTYQQVYDLAKTEESTNAQMDIIRGKHTSEVHAVRSRGRHNPAHSGEDRRDATRDRHSQPSARPGARAAPRPHPKVRSTPTSTQCGRCGGRHGSDKQCPAKQVKCYNCQKVGHFKRMCQQKRRQVHNLDEDNDSETQSESDDAWIGSIDTTVKTIGTVNGSSLGNNSPYDRIYVRVRLNDSHEMKLKVDTGSDACTITTKDLKRSGLTVKVKPSNCILNKYGGGIIKSYGTAKLKVTYKGCSTTADFQVVQADGSPSILGCRQSVELGIIQLNVHGLALGKTAALLSKAQVLQEYSDCFDKIGRFPGEKYKIKLIDDAQPVVHAPRSVPVHIMPLYKEELDKMLDNGIISPVSGPTDWVNSIVCNVTESKEGKKVRLCLDPKDLNKNAKREHYYTRTIDEILPKLHGKKYFSVIDTKKGYWHVELDKESSLLTTFNTPFGRYRFNRLPFGLWMSQDIFQPKLDAVYAGIDNVTGIADDIIVAGATAEEHDTALRQMLEASRRNNIGLNSTKLQFRQPKVKFYGHLITDKGIQPCDDRLEAIKNIKSPGSIKDLMTILGMVTYLNRFSTKLA